jgi:hypothetical protein
MISLNDHIKQQWSHANANTNHLLLLLFLFSVISLITLLLVGPLTTETARSVVRSFVHLFTLFVGHLLLVCVGSFYRIIT